MLIYHIRDKFLLSVEIFDTLDFVTNFIEIRNPVNTHDIFLWSIIQFTLTTLYL